MQLALAGAPVPGVRSHPSPAQRAFLNFVQRRVWATQASLFVQACKLLIRVSSSDIFSRVTGGQPARASHSFPGQTGNCCGKGRSLYTILSPEKLWPRLFAAQSIRITESQSTEGFTFSFLTQNLVRSLSHPLCVCPTFDTLRRRLSLPHLSRCKGLG